MKCSSMSYLKPTDGFLSVLIIYMSYAGVCLADSLGRRHPKHFVQLVHVLSVCVTRFYPQQVNYHVMLLCSLFVKYMVGKLRVSMSCHRLLFSTNVPNLTPSPIPATPV